MNTDDQRPTPLDYSVPPPKRAALQEHEGSVVLVLPPRLRLVRVLFAVLQLPIGIMLLVIGVRILLVMSQFDMPLLNPITIKFTMYICLYALMIGWAVHELAWDRKYGHLPQQLELDEALHYQWPGLRGLRRRSWRLDQIKGVEWKRLSSIIPNREVYEMRIRFRWRPALVRRFAAADREPGERFAQRLRHQLESRLLTTAH